MKVYYQYIIQEKIEDYWFDRYIGTDRRLVEEYFRVFTHKYNSKFRVVRLVL